MGKSRVIIRDPVRADAAAFLAAVHRSRALHQGWVSPPRTVQEFSAYLRRVSGDTHRGFLVLRRDTGELVGVINVSNIIHGAFHSGFLGYYAFANGAGLGFMEEGMRQVLRIAFRRLKLHRLEANMQPGNRKSMSLVKRCGFVREGYSRRYLRIAGRWRDHERWAILAEDYAAQGCGQLTR